MSDPFGLSKQRLEELRFAWNDIKRIKKVKTDVLNMQQFIYLLKSIGIVLKKKDIWILEQEHRARGDFTFEDLVHIGSVSWTEEVLEESLICALKEFDPEETGLIGIVELRMHLYKIGLGIRLSFAEIDAFLEQFEERSSGKLPIDKVILRLLAD